MLESVRRTWCLYIYYLSIIALVFVLGILLHPICVAGAVAVYAVAAILLVLLLMVGRDKLRNLHHASIVCEYIPVVLSIATFVILLSDDYWHPLVFASLVALTAGVCYDLKRLPWEK